MCAFSKITAHASIVRNKVKLGSFLDYLEFVGIHASFHEESVKKRNLGPFFPKPWLRLLALL